VFRLEAHDPSQYENQDGREVSEAVPSTVSIEPNGPPTRASLKRRRRRVLAGKVTIVHPMSTQALHEPPALAEPSDEHAPTTPQRSRGEVREARFISKRLQRLYDKLHALEKLVQAARALEAANAIGWIRQAMKTYGLDASDLAI
jgi:hypothetical protein